MTHSQDPFAAAQSTSNRQLGLEVVKALSSKGFEAVYADNRQQALDEVLNLIPQNSTVGIPGSVTIRQIGALEKLSERGCTIAQHWDPSLSPEEKKEVLKKEFLSDYFLTSSNALTQDGMLVNIDGTGNRVSAMAWGTNTLIFVVGINKIARDIDSALARIRDKATPPNAIRLNIDTPCTHVGHCVNCNSQSRVCRAVLILERPTMGRKTHVIVVGENLGY
ncbi:MAG: lactate utilization protein [Aminobacterium sp.]|jgi:hypothetical protein|uniref:LUD domain-containing protein n=1 Tax=bioreactor metagenome TaxID=1076179 RepID=A0A645D5P6_9ZZZZ|nr:MULTISPECIES: lactate utilization protein [unclassified Aminobacterium]MDD2206749.1 lactate utilization protein [Aminobacterium sp.]MDD3425989.1 lactate utilization protein [Aminobacterium sp.]MDD3707793.1 lactate utilization protein [Aminobacterium sp.]MDD4229141.1 lactate utilization protein [Aminobacterium sp.]MDD4552069.1 lactate utilization protein [Aminobacterium sp.]